MITRHLAPAEYALRIFGGPRKLDRLIGKIPGSTTSRWKRPRSLGGSDGDVPTAHWQRVLLAEARRLGLDLTANDLIFGRDVAMTEAELARN